MNTAEFLKACEAGQEGTYAALIAARDAVEVGK